jgi:hypothetical protein
LCADCAKRKTDEEATAKIYEDYVQTIKQIDRAYWSKVLPIVISGYLLILAISFGVIRDQTASLVFLCVSSVILMIVFGLPAGRQVQAQIAEASRTKPGFAEFYKVWKAEKSKEGLKTTGTVLAILLGAVAATAISAASSSKDDQIRNDLRSIQNKLDKM